MPRIRWLTLMIAVVPWVASPSATASVELNPGTSFTHLAVFANDANNSNGGTGLAEFESTAFPFPFSDSHTSSDGSASATSSYELSDAGFEITFEHARAGSNDASGEAQSYGEIFFRLDTDAVYELTGAYSANDSEGRHVILDVFLDDQTTGTNLFGSTQDSYGDTPNESFVLGGVGGDFSNHLAGSPSGPLTAGHEYRLFYGALIGDRPLPAVQPASASGFVRLAIVPEPSTAGLLLLGLIAIASPLARRQ